MTRAARILIVDNGGILVTNDGVFGDRRTRDFVTRCAQYFQATSYLATWPVDFDQTRRGVAWKTDLVHVVPVPVRFVGSYWSKASTYLPQMPLLWRTVRGSDFLYAFFPGTLALLCVVIARLLRKPYGVYLRGERGSESLVARWVFRQARFVIAHGDVLANVARQCCNNVELVIPMCPPLPQDAPRRRRFRTEGPWTLLFVGVVTESKGVHDLLEAVSLLHTRGIDIRLNLVGRNDMGVLPEFLHPLRDRVHFVGRIEDDATLFEYYEEADLFCLPSHHEGFPRVLYEAMAIGVPIVTTAVGGIPSLMNDGYNCLFVAVGNPSRLADVIEQALSSVDLRARLVEKGVATVRPILHRMAEDGHDKQLARKILYESNHASPPRHPKP